MTVFIYQDAEDFLKAIEDLEKAYNKKMEDEDNE